MSAMGDGLNAGAATFTPCGTPTAEQLLEPQGGPRRGSVMSDDSMLEEIEAELMAQGIMKETGGAIHGTAFAINESYPDLPPHADEFWFPECRNCPCCNGYKHGCQCCAKEGLRSCKCAPSGPTTAPPPPMPAPVVVPAAAQGGWMPAAPGPGSGQYAGGDGGGGSHPSHQPYGGGRGGGGAPHCRFFHSPGGCRFGDNCRFAHV